MNNPDIMPHKAVLFDLDGTLLDTLEDLADATNAALAEVGLPGHPLVAYKQFVGDGLENLVRRAMGHERADEALLARGIELTRNEYAARWAEKTRPYAGIPDLLEGLSRRGIPMAVLSNKPHEFTRLCVTRLLPDWHFQAVQARPRNCPASPIRAAPGNCRSDGHRPGRRPLSGRHEHRHADGGRGGHVPRRRVVGIPDGGRTAGHGRGRAGKNADGRARLAMTRLLKNKHLGYQRKECGGAQEERI